MKTKWKLICHYKLSGNVDSQNIYDEIFRTALNYKFRNAEELIVPINNKTLTESIFGLKSQDKLKIFEKDLRGKKLIELFITTLFLRYLEGALPQNSGVFIAIPELENNPCDTAIMITEPEYKLQKMPGHEREIKLPTKCLQFHFQIKEDFDFKDICNKSACDIEDCNPDKIISMVNGYSKEIVLVFSRKMANFQSDKFESFFSQYSNCYIISSPYMVTRNNEEIALDPNKHNYAMSFLNKLAIIKFDKPRFLS